MTQCHSWVDSAAFDDALHLHPTVQAVAEYNVAKLRNAGEPIATAYLRDYSICMHTSACRGVIWRQCWHVHVAHS